MGAYLGGPLLKGGVDEAQVRVVFCLGVHTRAYEVLNGPLNSLHVDAARQVAVLVHEVAMPVLLCCPLASPPARIAPFLKPAMMYFGLSLETTHDCTCSIYQVLFRGYSLVAPLQNMLL